MNKTLNSNLPPSLGHMAEHLDASKTALPIVRNTTMRQDSRKRALKAILLISVIGSLALLWTCKPDGSNRSLGIFHASVTTPNISCSTSNGRSTSHSGYIGLNGDTTENPKRSFFWYFEAENNPKNAPVILTIGGGPGTSGLMNPVSGQSPCGISAEGLTSNKNRWTEQFNLVALDHPIGAGYSYGTRVNNSRDAAIDVYDFLQKFFVLYPHLRKNKFILSGGSYGGIYVPNIATVINFENKAISEGKGQPGAHHINLESMMLSNPLSDPISHFRWLLHYRCVLHEIYNSTTCQELYAALPECLQSIQLAFEIPNVENRVVATDKCFEKLNSDDTHGTVLEDIRKKCDSYPDMGDCFPQFTWMTDTFNNASIKAELGVPDEITFLALNKKVGEEFFSAGDLIQPHYLMFPPLLKDGIRLLHYIGADDGNCGWPGVFSSLKLLQSPFQRDFLNAEDLVWLDTQVPNTTVRSVGKGAGDFTYILIPKAGHFVVRDQPALVKSVVEHWVQNKPFIN
ncbi:hypothetical protein M422DRAFT_37026 [Sphaerobolus stellatus SS14]|uniref:carboxypeptidase C n=1 Tax=Sphaerobolus stellatus (strain SS14) TaxID=990650 RepID=A0A0C9UV74_SPHS4|nr:hypothetical protein M422DRAFT_37026 [Sphaerobolus stellatus SS14]